MDFYQTDCEAILLQIRRQEKQLKAKRRWLLGLPTPVSGKKHPYHQDFLNNKTLPEFLLREDDVFYETMRTRVEEAFGVSNVDKRNPTIPDDQIFETCKIRRLTLSCLDQLNLKGLYLLAGILTQDSVKFEKTRWKLKRVVREFLPKVLRKKDKDHHQLEIVKQLSQLLNDPQNFRRRCLISSASSFPSYHDAVSQVLYRLGDLPTQSLLAMRRKLEGTRVTPQIKRHRHGWARDHLINLLTNTTKKMLSLLGEGDKLQESLAKAMAVADLSLKLVPGYHNFSPVEFYPFSPQIKTLQKEIVKAIWFISKKGNFEKLKKLQSLLDPDAKMSNRCLRTAIKKCLIDYLFESFDMETVPECLLKALAIINAGCQGASHSFVPQEEVENEVECVFSLSAHLKQMVLDFLPNRDFDNDFADAYMEELEESVDDFDEDENQSYDGSCQEENGPHTVDSDYPVEGTGESMPSNLEHSSGGNFLSPNQPFSRNMDVGSFYKSEHMHNTGDDSFESPCNYFPSFHETKDILNSVSDHKNGSSTNFSPKISLDNSTISFDAKTPCFNSSNVACAMPGMEPSKPSTLKNHYLVTQEACDGTSMIAYNFIGRLLEEFAKIEGISLDWCDHLYLSSDSSIEEDLPVSEEEQTHFKENVRDSVITRVCKELIPALPQSGMKKLERVLEL